MGCGVGGGVGGGGVRGYTLHIRIDTAAGSGSDEEDFSTLAEVMSSVSLEDRAGKIWLDGEPIGVFQVANYRGAIDMSIQAICHQHDRGSKCQFMIRGGNQFFRRVRIAMLWLKEGSCMTEVEHKDVVVIKDALGIGARP